MFPIEVPFSHYLAGREQEPFSGWWNEWFSPKDSGENNCQTHLLRRVARSFLVRYTIFLDHGISSAYMIGETETFHHKVHEASIYEVQKEVK